MVSARENHSSIRIICFEEEENLKYETVQSVRFIINKN